MQIRGTKVEQLVKHASQGNCHIRINWIVFQENEMLLLPYF